jgi:hypothetical protein
MLLRRLTQCREIAKREEKPANCLATLDKKSGSCKPKQKEFFKTDCTMRECP